MDSEIKTKKTISDDILFQIRNNKELGFRKLMKEYKEPLYWHIRRMVIVHEDADDVLQNMFIKAWKGIDNFRSDSALYTWLYRIATNEVFSFLANKRKQNISSITDIEVEFMNNIDAGSYFDGDNAQKLLQKAILELPEKQRLVFNMKYYEDLKYDEMSELLGTSVGALKASYHHAVKKIEIYLKNDV